MKEIKIFLDKEKKNEAEETIEFDPVVAGKTTTRKIYIDNIIDYIIDIEMTLKGKYVSISKSISQIRAHQTKEVIFELKPKITIMKPIKAQLKIKLSYVVA